MKNIAVLGVSGSIGKQTLDVIRTHSDLFYAVSMCLNSNVERLASYANEFLPKYVGIVDESKVKCLLSLLHYNPIIFVGSTAASQCAVASEVDIVVNAVSGFAGMEPFISAIDAAKIVAAANKESIVCAHALLDSRRGVKHVPLITPFENGARVIPVDSEQSAIFQCLEQKGNVDGIILTASGGAFLNKTKAELEQVVLCDALKHPTWNMGKKITIDSATLFNKGLEVMEAAYLFGMKSEQIEVLIHPQSIVHSMVRFSDGAIKAQLSVPDMRLAIQYALTYPNRVESSVERLNCNGLNLEFMSPDTEKYPALSLAYAALKENDVLPVVYNSANETAVEMFMDGETDYVDIPHRVEYAMSKTYACHALSLDDIIAIDSLARQYAKEWKGAVK